MQNDENLQGKKILILEQGLLTTEFYDFLRSCGMQVEYIEIENNLIYEYKSLKDKVKNILQRFIFRDKNYVDKLDFQFFNNYYISKIREFKKTAKNKQYDFILVIRPDNFSAETIKILSTLGKEISGYMWDGINDLKSKKLSQTRKLYKRLYCFDSDNIAEFPNLDLSYITNFFYPSEIRKKSIDPNSNRISYLGSASQERRDLYLQEISEKYLDKKYLVCFLFLKPPASKSTFATSQNIKYFSKKIPYTEYLDDFASSFASFDLKLSYHQGLSFRVFESLYYERKLISTNTIIKNFDFYHPDNILIINDDKDLQKINDFLEKPYCKISAQIINKYRADNWLKNIFHFDNFVEIKYPLEKI